MYAIRTHTHTQSSRCFSVTKDRHDAKTGHFPRRGVSKLLAPHSISENIPLQAFYLSTVKFNTD